MRNEMSSAARKMSSTSRRKYFQPRFGARLPAAFRLAAVLSASTPLVEWSAPSMDAASVSLTSAPRSLQV